MKIRITPLIILFVLVIAACQRPAPVLEPKKFKVPRTEEQMLVWLKEQNCEVEKFGTIANAHRRKLQTRSTTSQVKSYSNVPLQLSD